MYYNPERHHRRSIRLREYDYSLPGAYFVTICTQRRECLFGEVIEGEMRLSPYGRAATECWSDLPNHYGYVELDEFVIMPNHVHGIITIPGAADFDVGAGLKPAPTGPVSAKRHGLPEIVRGFKTFSSRRINRFRKSPGQPVWQRNYYEHVVRGDADLDRIRKYVQDNPAKWAEDSDNPHNFGKRRP